MKNNTAQNTPRPHSKADKATLSTVSIDAALLPCANTKKPSLTWPPFLPKKLTVDGVTYAAFGFGAQAAAYKAGECVGKVGHSFDQSRQLRQRAGDSVPDQTARSNVDSFNQSVLLTAGHLTSGRLNPRLVANARVDNQLRIWMDHTPAVETIVNPNAIAEYEPAKVKKLIDEFATFFLRSFKSGACDTECSLFTNYGFFPTTKSLTCFDFGSITYDYTEARKSVTGQVTAREIKRLLHGEIDPPNRDWPDWFYKGQVREALRPHPQLFNYYVAHMTEVVTLRALEQLWPKRYR